MTPSTRFDYFSSAGKDIFTSCLLIINRYLKYSSWFNVVFAVEFSMDGLMGNKGYEAL